MNKEEFKACAIILLIGLLSGNILLNVSDDDFNNKRVHSCKLYEELEEAGELNEGEGYANAFYVYDLGYCVLTKDRTLEDILDNDNEEVCHNLIRLDENKHFCKGG